MMIFLYSGFALKHFFSAATWVAPLAKALSSAANLGFPSARPPSPPGGGRAGRSIDGIWGEKLSFWPPLSIFHVGRLPNPVPTGRENDFSRHPIINRSSSWSGWTSDL